MLHSHAGKAIAAARQRRYLTQTELGAAVGLSVWTITAIETGKNRTPRPATIYRIADFLKLSVDDLFEAAA